MYTNSFYTKVLAPNEKVTVSCPVEGAGFQKLSARAIGGIVSVAVNEQDFETSDHYGYIGERPTTFDFSYGDNNCPRALVFYNGHTADSALLELHYLNFGSNPV